MKYEVYENNGGAVMLAILDDDCKPAAIFENWEYGQRGILADALQELAADPTAWRAWDGDLVERIASVVPAIWVVLAACIIDSDGDMIPAQRMGAAALKALGLSLEDDDQ